MPGEVVETAVPAARLVALNDQLLTVPEGFTVNPKLKRQLERRRPAMGPEGGIDWGHAEALAFASLLGAGIPIRLSGQDAERGTFSHRHAVLHDQESGATYMPLGHLREGQGTVEILDSLLSEAGALGFEYGYSLEMPEALVSWEAQFGTGVARHLADPAGKVVFATMEEGIYEVDVKTLAVTEVWADEQRKAGRHADLPGYHGKGFYSAQGRYVYANNGEHGAEALRQIRRRNSLACVVMLTAFATVENAIQVVPLQTGV